MDNDVLNFTKAIGKTETGGHPDPYNAKGKSGEFGAYQFMPATYKEWAGKYLGDSNAPMTVENQNKVAYSRVLDRKNAGLSPAQIASEWNSGDANKYKTGGIGVNSMGVAYNVPEYVSKVSKNYRELAQMSGMQSAENAQMPEQPQAPQQMTYDVPTDHSALQKNAQAEMEAAQLEAKKQSNPLRILGNTLLNIPKTLFNSASNLGETIGQSLATPEVEQNLSDANASIGGSQQRLINEIRRVEAEGGDATRLKQRYNQSLVEQGNNVPSLEEVVPGAFKSNAQVAGEVAGTGLDLLTAGVGGILGKGLTGKLATKAGSAVARSGIGAVAPELSAIADQTASGLLTKQGIKNVTKGAGIGYASDVTQGLQGERGEDREGANAFIPGFGTALGGGIPAISESVQSAKNALNPAKAVDDLEDSIIETYTGTKSRKKKLTNAERATEAKNRYTTGRTPTRVMAEDAIVPNIQGTKFNTAKQAEDYRESFSKLHDTNREVLSELDGQGARVRLNDLESDALREARSTINVDSGKSEGLVKATKREFANLRKVYGEEIPLSKLDEIKSARWKEASKRGLFDTQQQLNKDINYNIAKAAQRKIESVARRMGAEDVAQLNREIGDKLEAARFLEMLDGETVKGGRLGGYFARGIGAMAGGSVGGPIGTILGAFGGDVVANILMSNSVAGPVKRLILKRVQRQDPAAYTKTIAWLKKQGMDRDTRLALPERGGSVFSKREAVIAKNKEVAQKLGILKKDNLELPAGKPNEVGTVVNEGKPIRVAPQGAIETTGSEIVAGKTSPSQKPQSSPNMQNAATVDMVNEQGSYKQPLKDTVLNDTVPETEEVPTDIVTALNKSDTQKELQQEKDRIDEQIEQLKIQKDGLDSQYTSKSQEAAARKIAQSQSKLKEKQFTDESVVGKENTKRKRMAEQYSEGEIDENADEMNKIAEGYNKKQSDKKTLIQKIRENSQKQRELKATARKGGVKLLSGGGLGAAAGVETDEDGNITGYDFNKGVKGALGGVLFAGSVGSAFGDEARDKLMEGLLKAKGFLNGNTKAQGRLRSLVKKIEDGGTLTNQEFRDGVEVAKLGGVDIGVLPVDKKNSIVESPDGESLIVMHNISPGGILNAKRIGGLPSPSIGIAHKDFPFTGFGDVTLIADKKLIDPELSKNSKVFNADVYSPRYPSTNDTLKDNEALNSLIKDAESTGYMKTVGGLWEGVSPRDAILSTVRDEGVKGLKHSQPMKAAYLKEKGIRVDGDIRKMDIDWADYENWYEDKVDELDFDQKIFKGFTNSGYRKYVDANINNIVKEMGADARASEGMNYGVPSIRGSVAKKYKSITDIQKDRNKLVSGEQMEKIKQETSDTFDKLVGDLSMREVSSNLVDLMKKKISIDDFKQYTGADEKQTQEFVKFAKSLKDMPSEYFESKVIRPVGLQEFNSAIIPKGTSQKVIDHLKDKGIEIIEYSDNSDRAQKIKEQAAAKKLLFSLGAGAAAVTAAEVSKEKE